MTWFVEEGIGEHRALRIEAGHATAAMIDWPGGLAPGRIEDALLVSRVAGASRGRARFENGEESLVDRLPRGAVEGAPIRLEIIRARMSERGRQKLAHARPTDRAPRPAPTLREAIAATRAETRAVLRFPVDEWEEIWAAAWAGTVEFAGGSLVFSLTPAMTLVDVDGHLPPRDLAVEAARAFAAAAPRFGLGGAIGIDFPTLERKQDRKAVDQALDVALDNWPHERTAMNGFGFVQIVARLERPSLLHLLERSRAEAAARLLLRRAERVAEPGTLLLTCHPAVEECLRPEWRDELARRTGRAVNVARDPALALDGGFAQALSG